VRPELNVGGVFRDLRRSDIDDMVLASDSPRTGSPRATGNCGEVNRGLARRVRAADTYTISPLPRTPRAADRHRKRRALQAVDTGASSRRHCTPVAIMSAWHGNLAAIGQLHNAVRVINANATASCGTEFYAKALRPTRDAAARQDRRAEAGRGIEIISMRELINARLSPAPRARS